jgi:hypothetical protein
MAYGDCIVGTVWLEAGTGGGAGGFQGSRPPCGGASVRSGMALMRTGAPRQAADLDERTEPGVAAACGRPARRAGVG